MDIPARPDKTYRHKGWVSWGNWLGTGTIASNRIKFRLFREARAFARSLKLKGEMEWRTSCKGKLPKKTRLPGDIPTHPNRTYRGKGWVSWGDWLGTGTIAATHRAFQPFALAQAFARQLRLNSQADWRKFCKGELLHKPRRPMDIPARPDRVYASRGWVGWQDWLRLAPVGPHHWNGLRIGLVSVFLLVLTIETSGT